ncbi:MULTISPECIES: transglycosylase SLT domain-containing protein [unclassified Ensifer]|uniref:lytic transglycosylase domain-containing protein n=1 Tax=unclassified Ensifer TaxID=2633371 RepID=UPI000812CDA5|nr:MULTISPECIES: transglycosylase SLT domain-containing protein [unclassified Ensifer]OCP09392.1 lytic transglycosylase [Ensifer sp. LC13]OCP10569.1 lytic transglycosylase [Ensifer sp. LC11]OCP11673.1 lytic transglycosylase [Ensifer sp. LC14]OCP32640.1 lytic transglycosylase [Ensifer sp. LC499]
MRISSVAAVAACLGMFFAGMGTSYAGNVDKTIKTSSIQSVTRTTGYPKPDLPQNAQYTSLIKSYAKQYGVPVDLAHAVVKVESNFNAKARGSAGEIGLMQIKPATARMMGYSGSAKGLYDPETNIKFGMKYLAVAHELSGGTTCGTILKYNAGHGAKRMNPVSKRYCGKVQNIID